MSLPAVTIPATTEARVRRVHLPDDKEPGTVMGCAHGPTHYAHWYWSEAAGGRYLCRACHPWAIRRFVRFAEGQAPQGAVRINERGDMRVVR